MNDIVHGWLFGPHKYCEQVCNFRGATWKISKVNFRNDKIFSNLAYHAIELVGLKAVLGQTSLLDIHHYRLNRSPSSCAYQANHPFDQNFVLICQEQSLLI